MSSRYSFDSLVLREGRVFGWGWFLSERSPAERIELVVLHADGSRSRLQCTPAGTRVDLVETYPGIAHAGAGGYLIQGRLPPSAAGDLGELHVRLANGESEVHRLPGFPHDYLAVGMLSELRNKRVVLLEMLRHRDWRLLWQRLRSWVSRRWVERKRRARASRSSPAADVTLDVLMFDHAMGGGANHFRNELLAEWQAAGRRTALITPHLPSLEYELVRHDGDNESVARYPTLQACLDAIGPCREIVVNDLVSFDDPLMVLGWIRQRQGQDRSRVRLFIHDFFAACPSWSLIDDTGRYCGIPSLDRCRECLASNQAPFLSLMPSLDLPAWRAAWSALLTSADEVCAFSQSSVDILRRAFPQLPEGRVVVRPHKTDYLPERQVAPTLSGTLVIGVVGAIGYNKGATIVADMAAIIAREQRDARIVVIGTIDGLLPSAVVHITGPYRSEELPNLLEIHGVSVCLLPSICPETFSYVTSELMHYGMPLAVFDLGAPAERVRAYARGCIIPTIDSHAALEAAFALRATLQSSPFPASEPTTP